MWKRTGKCNKCGECCGWPTPDGGQTNPWPKALREGHPLTRLVGVPRRNAMALAGSLPESIRAFGRRWDFCWIPGWGLAVDRTHLWCPFLQAKGEEHPCLIRAGILFQEVCRQQPFESLATIDEVNAWMARCPSCSYRYVEV